MRPNIPGVGVRLVLMCWLVLLAGTVLAQLPPLPPLPFPTLPLFPGFPDLFGGSGSDPNQAATQLLSVGMDRLPAGQAPYGTDASGNAIWPISAPPAPTGAATTNPAPAPAAITNTGSSGTEQPGSHVDRTLDCIPKGTVTKETIRPLIEGSFPATPGPRTGRPAERWTAEEVDRMRYSFLYDLQQRAKFIYEGKNDLALAMALKWQVIGRLHGDQIDQVTMNIARQKNYPSFDLWIERVVQQDWTHVNNP